MATSKHTALELEEVVGVILALALVGLNAVLWSFIIH
jgi:hypothetical protein